MPLTTPQLSPESGLSVSVQLAKGYQTQYSKSDISRLVVGLVDVDAASNAYLGYEESAKGAAPAYHAAIAGLDAGGSHTAGLLSFSETTGLTTPQKVAYNRYLYKTVNAGIGATQNVTFKNIQSGSSRYIVFAAAFPDANGDGTPELTANAAIGFTQSLPFTVGGNVDGTEVNAAPPLTLRLNRGLGEIAFTLKFDEATHNKKLIDTDKLVISLVDADTARAPYFGYEGSTWLSVDPSYHSAIASPLGGLFDYTKTTLDPAERGLRQRMMYYTVFKNGFQHPAPDRKVRFTHLKPGNNYFIHAAVFTDSNNDGIEQANEANGMIQSPLPLEVTPGATISPELTLILN